VSGEFRTRELEVIAGEPRTETIHQEHGCRFKTDLAQAYFSPRLATERLRIARLVEPGEVITNMFAGVGCYSIVIAKHSKVSKVYSIDKNPRAFKYMRDNIRVNKVAARVVPIQGDARNVVERHLKGRADRVLMPLPELARDFFDVALLALKPEGGTVHFYDFGEEPDLFGSSLKFAREAAGEREVKLTEKRVVRSYAPKVYHVVLDLLISS
jgi:tRNA (guanine37-N1)-methyltransferase